MHKDLARLFNPRSIAIVGASQDLATISGQPLRHLLSHRYGGRIYPVNPKYPEILGIPCHASLEALPETPTPKLNSPVLFSATSITKSASSGLSVGSTVIRTSSRSAIWR